MQDIAVVMKEISNASITGFVCPMPIADFGAPFCHSVQSYFLKSVLFFTNVSLHALKSNHNISHEKATRELGYQPRPFQRDFNGHFEMVREKR